MDSQLAQYSAVLILLVGAVVLTGAMLGCSAIIGQRGQRSPAKDLPYECGMEPVGEGTPRVPVPFHTVAMLFLLFDVGVVCIYPLATVYKEMVADPETANTAVLGLLCFAMMLASAYVYAMKQRAFQWRRGR
ncbi:MAG: NADH-quinone oxidoreductase subunit A [Verrucomicrobiae bacterium]|nr:NADH-quinone oxidoreductase subunit A [Verrucomicrobiae bacterium]